MIIDNKEQLVLLNCNKIILLWETLKRKIHIKLYILKQCKNQMQVKIQGKPEIRNKTEEAISLQEIKAIFTQVNLMISK